MMALSFNSSVGGLSKSSRQKARSLKGYTKEANKVLFELKRRDLDITEAGYKSLLQDKYFKCRKLKFSTILKYLDFIDEDKE